MPGPRERPARPERPAPVGGPAGERQRRAARRGTNGGTERAGGSTSSAPAAAAAAAVDDVVRQERATIAAAMDALARAISAAQAGLRRASPATRALLDEHESWAENFIWTDGSQVAKAAHRVAAVLRRSPDGPATDDPDGRRRRQVARGR